MARREKPARGPLGAMARLVRPWTPDFVERLIEGSVNEVGRRTLYTLITAWDLAGGGPFAASAVTTAGFAKTADIVEDVVIGPVFRPLLKALGADDVAVRASLCASALIGLGIMRYAVRADPIHSMTVDELVDAMGPTLQRYLVGDIS